MTPQEQDMIQGLITRVNQTQLPEKDADAENLLQQSLGRNPDALYILSQTVLVQKYALDQAQKQLSDLKAQLDQSRQQPPPQEHHTSFLGTLLGHSDPPPPQPGQPQYAPVPNYAPSSGYGQAPPQYGAPTPGQSQGGGFLRSALQTATGVAAGALAFQGIESLMHGFGGAGGFGGGQGFGGFGSEAPREEIVNNYYGDADRDGNNNNGLSSDIEDRRDDNSGSQFAGGNDDSSNNSDSLDTNDDSSFGGPDDSSFDLGGNDDGSSGFGGGGDDSSFS